MKPFDAKEATIGCEVVTRDGRKGIVIHLNAKGDYPVVALISCKGYDEAATLTNEGHFRKNGESILDIFFPTKKHEGWVGIMSNNEYNWPGSKIYQTKEECENAFKRVGADVFVSAVHIEWEE